MSLAVQIALSAAAGLIGVSLLHLLRRSRTLTWGDAAVAVIVFAYFGATAFELLHDSWPAHEGRTVRLGLMLIMGLIGIVYMLRELVANWGDEDKLADLYSSQQGYIARPERLSPRTRAVLFAIVGAGTFAAVSAFCLQSLFSPE